MQGITKTIRELDPELYRKAKAQAAIEGKTIGQWISEAIEKKLNRPLRSPRQLIPRDSYTKPEDFEPPRHKYTKPED